MTFVAVALLVASCQSDGGSSEPYSIQDSAGVRITTVHFAPGELPAWSVSGTPELHLDGNAEPFFQAVTSAAWLSEGAIVALDRQADQLHVFGPQGEHVVSLGRSGDGPGEFGNAATVTVTDGDSIFVFDRSKDRVTVFHPEGGFVRDFSITPDSAGVAPVDVWMLEPNSFALYTEREDLSWRVGYDGQPFVGRSETLVSVHDGEGTRVAGPLVYSVRRYAQFSWGAGGLPLSPTAAIAGAAGRVIVGHGSQWQISIFDVKLRPIAFLRWPTNQEPISEADVDHVRERMETTLAPLGQERLTEILDLSFSEEALPDVRPAHGRVVAGRDGTIWVSRFEPYQEEDRWYIFDTNGAPIGRVRLPERSRLLAADGNSIIYVRPDSLDVQSVYVADVIRPDQ